MWPNLIMCNVNSADVMPKWFPHAANPNDVMCGVHDMRAQVTQASLQVLTNHIILIGLA